MDLRCRDGLGNWKMKGFLGQLNMEGLHDPFVKYFMPEIL